MEGLVSDRVGVVLMHRGDPDSPATTKDWLATAYSDPYAYRTSFASGAQKFLGGLFSRFDSGVVKKRLEAIGGRSGAAEQVTRLAGELEVRLNGDTQNTGNAKYKVLPAMRWTEPSIATAFQTLKQDGIGRVVAISLYPQQCRRFSNTLIQAAQKLGEGLNVSVIDRLENQPKYIEALRGTVSEALGRMTGAYVLFCALGIDKADAEEGDPYPENLTATVDQCMSAIERPHRLGWLEEAGPGLTAEFLVPRAKAGGSTSLVLVPVGTVVDELNVLYHLDQVLKPLAKKAGFTGVERAQAVATRPELLDALQAALKEHLERVASLGFQS